MKKLYLSLLGLALTGSAISQTTITRTDNAPVAGNTFSYHVVANSSISPGNAGANQTFDFSSLGGTAIPLTFVAATSTSQAASYPHANLAYTSGNSIAYFKINNNEYSNAGLYRPGVMKEVLTDPKVMAKFPMTFNDSSNETLKGTVKNPTTGQTLNRKGTTVITADAYGDLKLPYGTIQNVLRVKAVHTYSDKLSVIKIADYTDSAYLYFHPNTKNFIASHISLFINGNKTISSVSYLKQSSLDVFDIELNQDDVTVYPNPSTGIVNLQNIEEFETIEVYDATGRLVRSLATGKVATQQIDLSDLNKGMYIIVGKGESTQFTKELMIH